MYSPQHLFRYRTLTSILSEVQMEYLCASVGCQAQRKPAHTINKPAQKCNSNQYYMGFFFTLAGNKANGIIAAWLPVTQPVLQRSVLLSPVL